MESRGRTVVFNHIPKAGGTSTMSALVDALGGAVVDGYDTSLFGQFDGFAGIDAATLANIYLPGTRLPAEADLIGGHFAVSTTRDQYPHADHMTVLREGRARLLSHWVYWRSLDDESLRPWGEWGRYIRKGRGSLADFLADPEISMQTDNVAVRTLLWPNPLIRPDEPIPLEHDESLLGDAFDVLRGFGFVGVAEDDDWPLRLERWLGLPFRPERLNETSEIPSPLCTHLWKELTPSALGDMARLSRLDNRLWEWAASRVVTDVASVGEAAFVACAARHAVTLAPNR